MWFKQNKKMTVKAPVYTPPIYTPPVEAEWKEIEFFDRTNPMHVLLGEHVCNLCFDITQILGDGHPPSTGGIYDRPVSTGGIPSLPYSTAGGFTYEDEIVLIACKSTNDMNGYRGEELIVTYKPKDVEVFRAYFQFDDVWACAEIATIIPPRPRKPSPNTFRLGSWIDHIFSLEPQIKHFYDNYPEWKKENDKKRERAVERVRQQPFSRLE